MTRKELKQQLIDEVIEGIKAQLLLKDETAIDELLTFVRTKNLIQFLNEDEWEKYSKLWKIK